jgi:lysyl-tRNA synthetase class 2
MALKSENKFPPEILVFRHKAKTAIRAFLEVQGFIEVDTPYLLSANTPDPYIDPIYASSHSLGNKLLQLHTSPEIWLKKGLALGLSRIYQMARVFRDDPLGQHHNREFTMLEWYRADANLEHLIRDCEGIFQNTFDVGRNLGLVASHFEPKFIRTDLETLFRELANIDLLDALSKIAKGSKDHLQTLIVREKGDHLPQNSSFSDAFFHVMLKYIEPNLPSFQPVVISRWPTQLAALASPCSDNPYFCDRFEIYFRGFEIANAYQECANPEVLRTRFKSDNQIRQTLGKPIFSIDETFLKCLDGLPEIAGIALGIDRLFLAVLEKNEIADIIFGFGDQ